MEIIYNILHLMEIDLQFKFQRAKIYTLIELVGLVGSVGKLENLIWTLHNVFANVSIIMQLV